VVALVLSEIVGEVSLCGPSGAGGGATGRRNQGIWAMTEGGFRTAHTSAVVNRSVDGTAEKGAPRWDDRPQLRPPNSPLRHDAEQQKAGLGQRIEAVKAGQRGKTASKTQCLRAYVRSLGYSVTSSAGVSMDSRHF